MIKEFTFITITYNQEPLIFQHLNSIKEQIIKFGKNIDVFFILADDHSTDNTVLVVEEWLKNNCNLFKETYIIQNQANLGSVKNILNAINHCRTDCFKILAGDDSYNENEDIFEVYNNLKDEVIITPIIPICEENKKNQKYVMGITRDNMLVQFYSQHGKLNILLAIRNHLMAPGVFVPSKYWRDEKIQNELMSFKYIEDYPMWINLFIKRNIKGRVLSKQYIKYRISVASRKINNQLVNDIRADDNNKLKELYYFKVSFFQKCEYYFLKTYFTLKNIIINKPKNHKI